MPKPRASETQAPETPVSELPPRVTFQDALFSSERVVQRTLAGGTVLQLTLEPLAGERVRVLRYLRRRAGERWVRVKEEEGRTVAWRQLGLEQSFRSVFY